MNVTARGGYQIIDFAGIVCAPGGSVTVPGIYKYLSEMLPSRKPAFLYNFTVSVEGQTMTEPPQPAKITQADSTPDDPSPIIIMCGEMEISITSDDAVSI